jgi:hypothetical protein
VFLEELEALLPLLNEQVGKQTEAWRLGCTEILRNQTARSET